MKLLLPKTDYFSYNRNVLAEIGNILKKYLKKNQNLSLFFQDDPKLSPQLLKLLNEEIIDLFLKIRLIRMSDNEYLWHFMPIYGHNLLLFCDLPKFKLHTHYVWVSENLQGGSWAFARSLPVKKGVKVLDLGTGTGLLALNARLKGGTSLGVDINSRAIKLSQLNRDLNGLDAVSFQHCDWKTVDGSEFDVIVSQPPFAPYLKGTSPSYAFNGGDSTGLQATREIIERFFPQKGQTLALYVHIPEDPSHSRFQYLLQKWLDSKRVSINIKPQFSYAVDTWWCRFKNSRELDPSLPLPSEFQSYSAFVAYFVYLKI
ncbi:MAG: methyltransferase [Promethearchaeota archaeon]